MTVTEALCLLEVGWHSSEEEELYQKARRVIWSEASRIRLEHRLEKTKQQLADIKGENND